MPNTSLDITNDYYANYDSEARSIATDEVVWSGFDNVKIGDRREYRITSNTPGWKKDRRAMASREVMPMNPFTYHLLKRTLPSGVMRYHHPDTGQYGRHYGPFWNQVDPDRQVVTASEKSEADTEALYRLYEAAKDSDVNAGIILGEAHQTKSLILDTAKSIAEGLSGLRRGKPDKMLEFLGIKNPKRPKELLKPLNTKQIASRVLEWQFGWKPLYQDIFGTLIQLDKRREQMMRTRIVGSRTVRRLHIDRNAGDWYQVPVRLVKSHSYTRRYVAYVVVQNAFNKTLADWGITNPASVLWELTPWSFLFDYFLPIGRYIDSFDAWSGLTLEVGSNTSFEKWSKKCKTGTTVGRHGGYTSVDGESRETLVHCERSIFSSVPNLPLPSFTPKITGNRAVNMLALFRQQLKL